jgi:Kef-type K+ transport system membrane component KefB
MPMSFALLAVIGVAALAGPLLALTPGARLPTILGELGIGVVLGPSALGVIRPADATLSFLATIGFALVMFVAGTHVPVRHIIDGRDLRTGAGRAAMVGGLAIVAASLITALTGGGHVWVYAVLLASSSAAVVVPILERQSLEGDQVSQLLVQVAVADVACVVLAPFAVGASTATDALRGTALMVLGVGAFWLALRAAHRSGAWRRVHLLSEKEHFALELRLTLVVLFAMSALAELSGGSILVAAFGIGLAFAAVGPPRRLSRQVFGVTEGFLGPVFFVWFGSTLDVQGLASDSRLIGVGVLLGTAAVVVHVAMRLTGQPLRLSVLAAAQLGLPVAVVTLGERAGGLTTGEGSAIILGALITLVAVAVSGLPWWSRVGTFGPAHRGEKGAP